MVHINKEGTGSVPHDQAGNQASTRSEDSGEAPHKTYVAVKKVSGEETIPATPALTEKDASRETKPVDPPGAPQGSTPADSPETNAETPSSTSTEATREPSRETTHEAPPEASRGAPQQKNDPAKKEPGPDKEKEDTESNGRENQVVHTPSVSIKNVLKGHPREIPVADKEIDEQDQVAKADPGEGKKAELTEEMVRKAWKDYAASIEKTHPRIFTTLSQQEPRLNESGIIQINLNTEAQRENFIHRIKPELTRYFQNTIADIDFVFETNLIENETTVKKVYTDQDKLDFLIRKNPDLEKMKSKFNLDFDD